MKDIREIIESGCLSDTCFTYKEDSILIHVVYRFNTSSPEFLFRTLRIGVCKAYSNIMSDN